MPPSCAYRLLKDGTLSALFERNAQARIPVLLVGAGDGADLFIREMARGQEAPYRVVGIVDDRDSRTGRQIRGVRVMGGLDDLAAVVERLTGHGIRPQRLVLTRARMDGATVRRVFEQGDALGVPVSRMPRVGALDILAQHVMGCACSEPFDALALYEEIRTSGPYRALAWEDFEQVVDFVSTGGYALRAYDRFRRIVKGQDGLWRARNADTILWRPWSRATPSSSPARSGGWWG